MLVTVKVSVSVDEDQYIEKYKDYFDDRGTSIIDAVNEDVLAHAQHGVDEWAKRLSLDIKIINKVYE